MTQPRISIIIPTLNSAKSLQRAIDSVRSQDYKDIELIIIDGKSSDGTFEIIENNSQHIAKWISEPDNGIYDAMEKGVRLATGNWIHFLGSDDVLVNCLNKVKDYLKNSKTIYYGDVYYTFRNIVYDGKFNWEKLSKRNICQQAIFYPREVFNDYKFNKEYKVLADYEFNIRCWGEGNYKFEYIPILIAIYDDHSGTSFNNSKVEGHRIKYEVAETYFGRKLRFKNFLRKILGR